MAKVLKDGRSYTTKFGNVETTCYAMITYVSVDFKNQVAKNTLAIYNSESDYLAGEEPYAIETKICEGDDWDTFVGSAEAMVYNYWDNETTHVDAGTYIRDDWEDA